MDTRILGGIRHIEGEIGDYANPNISKLDQDILCTCGCVIHCTRCSACATQRREH
jgi:hypothetical protein